MLGAMDNRVSEEVRRTLTSTVFVMRVCPHPVWLCSPVPGNESVLHALSVLSGGLHLPQRPFQPQLQRGHEPPDSEPQHQSHAGGFHTSALTETHRKNACHPGVSVPQGQAQECLLEKSMLDNRKSFLVARISAQVWWFYYWMLCIFEDILTVDELSVLWCCCRWWITTKKPAGLWRTPRRRPCWERSRKTGRSWFRWKYTTLLLLHMCVSYGNEPCCKHAFDTLVLKL